MSVKLVMLQLIALLNGGWMMADGMRAMLKGDYFTFKHQPGELGPWASLLERCGINPRSFGVKVFITALGAGWLLGLLLVCLGNEAFIPVLHVVAIGTLWYLPLGTILSLACLFMLNG